MCLFIFSTVPTVAQNNEMFKQKRERKRTWRKWRSNKNSYNPYLEKSAKNKPSARMAKGNRKELRIQKRRARRQMRHNKKTVNS